MKNGVKYAHKLFEEIPDEASEDGKVEIWCDRRAVTTKPLEQNYPKILVVDCTLKHWTIVDFVVLIMDFIMG